jgi:hypothetical protein
MLFALLFALECSLWRTSIRALNQVGCNRLAFFGSDRLHYARTARTLFWHPLVDVYWPNSRENWRHTPQMWDTQSGRLVRQFAGNTTNIVALRVTGKCVHAIDPGPASSCCTVLFAVAQIMRKYRLTIS